MSAFQEAELRDNAKQLVVRVQSTFENATEVGGGLITVVSPSLDRVYIVTANHVVRMRNEANTPAKEIKVRFNWSPESFPADLMDEHFDKSADLAVLRLRNIKDLGIPANLPFAQVASSAPLRLQSKVYTLGFPMGRLWFLSVTPDAVASTGGDTLRFQTAFLEPGHSGGVLLDEKYRAVGLLLESTPPEGKALRIEYILNRLQEWGYKPNWQLTLAESAPTMTRRVLRLLYADVIQDGSGGTTRWDIQATVNGKQLFDWKGRDVDDDRGKNRIVPDPGDATMEIDTSGDVTIEVKGDHTVGNPKPATGKGVAKTLGQISIPVKAAVTKEGSFNFVFVLEEKR